MAKSSNSHPLQERIYAALKQRIEAGEWGYGAMLPTENELCESYRISRGTVRNVLAELEKEGLVRRERGRGTFMALAGIERSSKGLNDRSISFIVPYVRDSHVSSILLGVESAARAGGYEVLFNHVENDPEKEEKMLIKAGQQGVAGIILYPTNSATANPAIAELVRKNYPFVLVDRYERGLYTDYVTSDNFGGGLLATQHLLCLGHRRIAFVSWTEMATTMEHRRSGYRQALLETGISPEPGLEWDVVGYPDIDQAALEERLSREDGRPTAIFAANDQLAIAIQRAARKLNISIPEELALVGFDNLDISAHLDIPLTTVAQPAFEIGRTAGELVINKVAAGKNRPGGPAGGFHCFQRRILPVELLIRRSCGAMKGS
jgi:DNA-binding LacI/PurR family transcriptional regulator